ncbi:hypothetical protein Tco_1144148 [Tanacetum coccineum]
MADLAFVKQHNMVAYLEKTEENTNFHQILDFLTSSSINFALTISPTIYASYIEQFLNTACLKTINSEKQIHANVDGKVVVVSESSVRRDLHLNDEDGTACLTTNEIFENLALMGYEPTSDKLAFYKVLFSPQWKYLIHTILHCLSSKSTSWDQFSTNLAYELGSKEVFNVSKVFTNMRKPGKGFSGRVTPLFHNMLVPPVVVGEGLEQSFEPQPTPSTAPSKVLSLVTTAATSQPPKDPSTYRRTKRGQNTKVPQSGGSPNKVGDEAINEEMLDSMERAATTATSLEAEGIQAQTRFEGVSNLSSDPPLSRGYTFGSGEDSMEHQIELTNNVPNTPHDSPLLGVNTPRSDEGRLKLKELMAMCTKLSKQVLELEKEKDAQAVEILKLKKRVKKLERQRNSSISHPRRRIYRKVESFDDDLDKEDASKQGRISDKTKPMFKDSDFDNLYDLVDEGMAFVQEKDVDNQGKIGADDTEVVKGRGDTEAVNTAGEGVSTASVPEIVSTTTPRTPPTTTTFFDDEDVTMAMAQTLIKMKEEKAKEKGVAIKDVEDSSRPIRSITTLQPLPTIDPKDKAEMFDEVHARIDVDYELAARMTQEQEKYTIEERARLLAKFFERRKKQLAVERAEAIRNKPPTKTQLRNLMMTYLKNMGGYKHSQLKGKSYEEIQGLYERQQKRIQDFTPIDSEKEAQKPGKILKRVTGSYATHKSPKKSKVMKSAKDVTEEEAAEYEKEKQDIYRNA